MQFIFSSVLKTSDSQSPVVGWTDLLLMRTSGSWQCRPVREVFKLCTSRQGRQQRLPRQRRMTPSLTQFRHNIGFCRTSSHSLAGSDVSPATMNVTLQAGSAIAELVLLRARRCGQSALPVGGSFIVPTTASASGSDVSFGSGGCDAAQFIRSILYAPSCKIRYLVLPVDCSILH